MAQLTKTFIGLILVGLMATGFLIFTAYGNTLYAPPGYNDSSVNKLQGTLNKTNDIINSSYKSVKDSQSNTGIVDIVGNFLSQSLAGIKIAVQSFDIWILIIGEGASIANLGSFTNVIIGTASAIILVLFIGILLHVLTKSDRV